MKYLIPVVLLFLAGCSTPRVPQDRIDLKSLPALDGGGPYSLEPFIPTVMLLQRMGPKAGSEALLQAASPAAEKADRFVFEKVTVLCRMLFTARAGSEFQRPSLGGTDYPGGTTAVDWPLEPIELVDGYPFCIAEGYRGGGFRHPVTGYVSYCITNCDWSTFRYRTLTMLEKRRALAKILASPKWKRPLNERERLLLSLQIE
jgi:hypothetical protein